MCFYYVQESGSVVGMRLSDSPSVVFLHCCFELLWWTFPECPP